MNENAEIIRAYDSAKANGQACVLATVVHLEGSSYRRPGARMLVLEDGLMIGAISGGCLEGDALNKALLTFSEKRARIITYDTSDEEDATIGVQLGCEGIIHVLFEYIDVQNEFNPIELLRKAISKRRNAVIVTLFNLNNRQGLQVGTCLLYESDRQCISTGIDRQLPTFFEKDIFNALEKGTSLFVDFSNHIAEGRAFIEVILPVIALVIVGAGNDAIPMMQIGAMLGWEVKVVDGRKTHAKQDRFVSACQVLVSKPEKVLSQIAMDSRTCFVLMTHNYNYDLQMLKGLLETDVPYIGVLGPKKKLNKMLEELYQSGVIIPEKRLSNIYGPTGLDIGAETAAEIATSIIAEIQAVMNAKNGHMLKLKKDVIHS